MQKHQFHGSDADKTAKKGMSPYDEFIITTGTGAGSKYEYRGATAGWVQTHDASGAAHVSDKGFVPSSYDANLTMNGTAQGVALATGARKIQIANLGATTEAIRVAFGTSELDAEANLNISAGAATTGYLVPAAVDGGGLSSIILGIPSLATHYAVANAVASDTQLVAITQGI